MRCGTSRGSVAAGGIVEVVAVRTTGVFVVMSQVIKSALGEFESNVIYLAIINCAMLALLCNYISETQRILLKIP